MNSRNAATHISTMTGHVVYKSLSNCCVAVHEFKKSYASRSVWPVAFLPVGMQRCKTGVLWRKKKEKIDYDNKLA